MKPLSITEQIKVFEEVRKFLKDSSYSGHTRSLCYGITKVLEKRSIFGPATVSLPSFSVEHITYLARKYKFKKPNPSKYKGYYWEFTFGDMFDSINRAKCLNYLIKELKEQAKGIDLRTCKPSDLLVSSQGTYLTYLDDKNYDQTYPHQVRYRVKKRGIGSRIDDGHVFRAQRRDDDEDIVQIIHF